MVAKEVQNISQIASSIQTLYAGSADYSTLTTQALINANLIPSSMINGNNIINSWGQTVGINPVGLFNGHNNGFSIQSSGVPVGPCTQLVMAIGNSTDYILLNSTWIRVVEREVVDGAQVSALCAAGGNNNYVQFDWH